MEICEINQLQYYFGFDSSWKCSLSDYYVNIGKKVFVLMDNNEPLSFLICSIGNHIIRIFYIFTPEDQRRKGYATALLKSLKNKFNYLLTAEVNADWPFYDAFKNCLEKLGFTSQVFGKVYKVNYTSQFSNFLSQQNPEKAISYLKSKGFECKTFAQMSEDIKNQVYNSSQTEFKNPFNIKPYFDCPAYKVDYDCSMVLVKDGKLRAYILCTRSSNDTLFLEHATESYSDIGNGIITYPVFEFLNQILKKNELKQLCFVISNTNKRSLGFVLPLIYKDSLTVTDTVSFLG